MNLLERVLTLLRANVETLIEKSNDPEKALQQLQLDMRNQLVQVKTQVATAIAESYKLQGRGKEKATEAETWLKKAELALRKGQEEVARAALVQHNDITRLAQRYQQQQKEQEQFISTMRSVLRQLETRIAEIDATIELLTTRRRNALIQQRIYDALNKAANDPIESQQAARAQDAVLDAEARARALASLHQQSLDIQLDNLSKHQTNAQQSPQPPLLENPQPFADPLIAPLPTRDDPEQAQPAAQTPSVSPVAGELDIAEIKRLIEVRRRRNAHLPLKDPEEA